MMRGRIGIHSRGFSIDVLLNGCAGRSERAVAGSEQSRYAAACCGDSRVEEEARINLIAARILRTRKSRLDSIHLFL